MEKDKVATCVISYVETYAAFARLHREQIFTDEQFEIVKHEFVEDWEAYFQIPLTQSVRQRAAQLAEIVPYVLMIVFSLLRLIFCLNNVDNPLYLPVLINV